MAGVSVYTTATNDHAQPQVLYNAKALVSPYVKVCKMPFERSYLISGLARHPQLPLEQRRVPGNAARSAAAAADTQASDASSVHV